MGGGLETSITTSSTLSEEGLITDGASWTSSCVFMSHAHRDWAPGNTLCILPVPCYLFGVRATPDLGIRACGLTFIVQRKEWCWPVSPNTEAHWVFGPGLNTS